LLVQDRFLIIWTGNKNMYNENREMYKVTCAECGKETEVPFKPDGTRPVYCRECFQKRRPRRF
jgi:CxxC-x17-CxxC domain-containing protein